MRDVNRVLFIILIMAGVTGKSYAQEQFPIGTYYPPYDRVNQRFVRFDQLDSLRFNRIHLTFGVTGSNNPNVYRPILLEGMDSAAVHGMETVISDKKIEGPARGQRSIYQAESYEFDLTSIDNHFTQKGSQYLEIIDPQGDIDVVQAIDGTHTAGMMVWDPQPLEQEQTGTYYVKPRLRVEGGQLGDPVVTVRAILLNTPPQTLLEQTIIVDQDNSVGYHEYSFSFYRPSGVTSTEGQPDMPMGVQASLAAVDPVTYEVEWHGEVTTFFDYLKVDDYYANKLFRGDYDAQITSAAQTFLDHPTDNLLAFYTDDEPKLDQMYSAGYVESILKGLAGPNYPKGGGITASSPYRTDYSEFDRDAFDLFMSRASQPQLAVDLYPFRHNNGSPYQEMGFNETDFGISPYSSSDYNTTLQNHLNYFLRKRIKRARNTANTFDVPLWYIPQLHGWYRDFDEDGDREYYGPRNPTPWEIAVEVNMGLAHGAEAIFYFLYENPEADQCCPGLVQTQTHRHDINYDENLDPSVGPVFTGYQLKWDAVRELNQRLNILGPTLANLDWQTGYPISTPENNFIVSSVTGATDI